MDVKGPSSVPSVPVVRPSVPTKPSTPTESPAEPQPGDRVELSADALAANSASTNDLRAQRLARIKAAIDADTYETPDKLEAALNLLFREAGSDLDL